jgi:AcrR family transcriptional regulator
VTTPARDRTNRDAKKNSKKRTGTAQKVATKGKSPARKVATKPAGGVEIRLAVTEAAERLFRERSPADVTLREIAAEAGVNYSLVYRYFRSKDALIAAVFAPRVQGLREKYVDTPGGPQALRQVKYMHDVPGYARALAWVILEGNNLDLLFQDVEPEGEQGEANGRSKPLDTRLTGDEIDSRIAIGSFLALAMGWDLYEPYLLRLTGLEHVDKSVLNKHLVRIADALLTPSAPAPKRNRARN